mmetsp:Transcript_15747/g.23876  ORF Transcript_15747/g.23876 Transcript_15747/m.23876 type:complete len:100 (-) Transcript_15747:279-578(-)|eukprot:CAMPEP_0196141904 /NCGR_PEP_ID=MMETSP0910-20130528/10700_1 /TAXON_ID=49265 /ORGANISM="Thalassiosira rotula, Strain GSO102" /LENGTH=99 /DNA_ID=CAMNT_0041403133 /DNA_START=43 /DNA_END=342 /DNA_ORIENTATION=+
MNKFIAALLIVAVSVNSITAFTSQIAPSLTRTQKTASIGPALEIRTAETSTALNLKVKVDPNAKTTNTKGNAKMAAYGGSIVFAALLPIAFLVWSAVSK